MKRLCHHQLPLEQYRDDVCGALRQALWGQRLFQEKCCSAKAQRRSNDAPLICASMFREIKAKGHKVKGFLLPCTNLVY